MPAKILYFVNSKTRIVQMLSGPENGEDHLKNIRDAKRDGFVEVTEKEMEAFRAETKKAKDAGWDPRGTVRYSTFMNRVSKGKRTSLPKPRPAKSFERGEDEYARSEEAIAQSCTESSE
ncbi:hypothetical protein Amme1_00175 [Pseudomonas phage vB_PpuM-Amme-1]